MAASSCDHKDRIGCALTALSVCCSCADQRPHEAQYPIYIDGEGIRMKGKRWQRYCWRCQNHWDFQHERENHNTSVLMARQVLEALPRRVEHQLGASTPARTQDMASPSMPFHPENSYTWPPSVQPTPSAQSIPDADAVNNNLMSHSRQIRRARRLQNPFGTREELESPDYQSPLAGMFTRAWDRYRTAEEQRQTTDRQLNEIGQNLLLDSYRANRANRQDMLRPHLHETDVYPASGSMSTQASHLIEQGTGLRLPDLAELYENHNRTSGQQPPPRPQSPRPSPIDLQRRPPPIPAPDLVLNMACKICCDQKMDTLLEPCMHVCMCHWCAEILRQQAWEERRLRLTNNNHDANGWKCPICRRGIVGVRRIHIA